MSDPHAQLRALWDVALDTGVQGEGGTPGTPDPEAESMILAWLRKQRAAQRAGAPRAAYPGEAKSGEKQTTKRRVNASGIHAMVDLAAGLGLFDEDDES